MAKLIAEESAASTTEESAEEGTTLRKFQFHWLSNPVA